MGALATEHQGRDRHHGGVIIIIIIIIITITIITIILHPWISGSERDAGQSRSQRSGRQGGRQPAGWRVSSEGNVQHSFSHAFLPLLCRRLLMAMGGLLMLWNMCEGPAGANHLQVLHGLLSGDMLEEI